MTTKKQKWNKEVSNHTMKLVADSAGVGVQYIREILRGDRNADLLLAAKISDAIKKHCPVKTLITARSMIIKEKVKVSDRVNGEKGK